MRTIVHLSDLHFGATRDEAIAPLAMVVATLQPDLVAVSGDLTQRARPWQFIAAREFLERLPCAKVIVPGNHDVPLYNLYERFRHSLANYGRYISTDLEPFYLDQE